MALLLPLQSAALQGIEAYLSSLEGPGVKAEELFLRLLFNADLSLSLQAGGGRLTLTDIGHKLSGFELDCRRYHIDGQTMSCRDARLRLGHAWLDSPWMNLQADWDAERQELRLRIDKLQLAGGSWRLQLQARGQQRRLQIEAQAIDLAALQQRLADAGLAQLPDLRLAGRSDLNLDVRLQANRLVALRGQVSGRIKQFEALASSYLGEDLDVRLELDLKADGGNRLDGTLALGLQQGALLTPFVYLEPGAGLQLSSGVNWTPASRQLVLRGLSYRHADILRLDAELALRLDDSPALLQLQLSTGEVNAQSLYQAYLQPLLSTSLLADVAWQGGFNLRAEKPPDGGLQLQLGLNNLTLRDQLPGIGAPRFLLQGLQGRLYWRQQGGAAESHLAWRQGQLLGALDIGAASLQAQLNGNGFALSKPLRLPLLDGQLLVDRLDLAMDEQGEPQVDFDAILTPVTLQGLTEAFGWPPLSGSVSGVLPGLKLRQGELKVEGNLLVRVFDGDILIRQLRLQDLFSPLPVMQAEIDLKNMDLNELTRTFSFGKITGRLSGHMHGLRLEAWRPVAFDAKFYTPQDDASKHSISQKAVDNISNLGGAGIAGALSRSFLGIFENFGYERLGIGCVLKQGVCAMSGVRPAEQGYYLVIGSGIPQITIKGFNAQADWNRLVSQLQEISASGSPVVQ